MLLRALLTSMIVVGRKVSACLQHFHIRLSSSYSWRRHFPVVLLELNKFSGWLFYCITVLPSCLVWLDSIPAFSMNRFHDLPSGCRRCAKPSLIHPCWRARCRYSVDIAGTLLGYIRGGDFMPWDDDIDVRVHDDDWAKFEVCSVCCKLLINLRTSS